MGPGFALAFPSAVIDVSSFRKCSIPFISESRTVPGPMLWWFSQSGSSENAEWINEWMHTFKWTKITSIMFPFKNIYLFWIVFEKDPWGLEIETGNFGNDFFFPSPFASLSCRLKMPVYMCAKVTSVMSDSLLSPCTVARQAPLSMGFSRQEYWSGLPCPPPGDFMYFKSEGNSAYSNYGISKGWTQLSD